MIRILLLAIAVGSFGPISEAQADGHAAVLDRLVHEYFTRESPADRKSLARKIEAAADGSLPALLDTIRRLELWPGAGAGNERFSITLPQSRPVAIECAYPERYDPSIAYPALLCMPSDGQSTTETLALARRALGDSIREFVLLAPARSVGGTFHLPGASAGDFTALVYELRRRIHIDPDRLFLFGSGTGGDAAWLAAMFHPDIPAGVITLASYPHVPYAAQTLPFLLPNLRRVPVLSVWTGPSANDTSLRRVGEVAHNRAIRRIAEDADLPIVGLEVSADLLDIPAVPADQQAGSASVRAILAGNRAPVATEVALWFRYPQHGQVAWLRCTRFAREVWDDLELSIRPGGRVDRDAFIAGAIQGKMAYLSGRIEGQRIDITARRCRRVELALPDGLIDFTRPVTVRCNGKIRLEGRIEPSIATLLESAQADWDFQRPAVARFSFSIKRQRAR